MSLNIIIDADVTQASQAISKFSYEIKKSFGSINTVVDKTATGFQYGVNKMAESTNSFAKASTNSLTALSLTLQDLPFGFIGIQNNLPGIVQGFGQMSAAAKTGASVMSQLGTALVGPAGLFLAFSAVTSIVTSLVMEYGSLGEAMNAIFGKTNSLSGKIKELSESYKEFNKQLKTSQDIVGQEKASTSSQVTELQTLSKIILNQTKSYNERNAALNRLKEINKDYFGNLTLETLKTKTLTDAVTGYKDSLQQGAITKGFQEQLTKTNLELSKQQILLEQLQDATDAARRAPVRINRVTGEINTQEIKNAESAYNKQLQVVNALKKSKSELNKEIENSVKAQIILRGPVDAATAALEKQKKADKELAAAKKKIKPTKELDLAELSRKARIAANKLEQQAEKNRLKYLQEQLKLEEKITKETFAQADKDMKADAELFSKDSFKKLSEFTKPLDELQKSFEATKFFLQDIFFNPLQDLFKNFLDTGKFTFQEFGKVVLDSIKKIVAQIAAQQVVGLLAQLLNPMGAIASTGVLGNAASNAGKGQKGILGALSNIFLGRVANPNFGGVGGGQMGMSGSVNLVLRGTDLVGSINRTNAQISRVG